MKESIIELWENIASDINSVGDAFFATIMATGILYVLAMLIVLLLKVFEHAPWWTWVIILAVILFISLVTSAFYLGAKITNERKER